MFGGLLNRSPSDLTPFLSPRRAEQAEEDVRKYELEQDNDVRVKYECMDGRYIVR